MSFHLTEELLLADLHQAYTDACRHKHSKPYVENFELHREENLKQLCSELWHRTYRPGRSSCFLIKEPKLREVFAAEFRDRIVHHLYFNYTHVMYEHTFIRDSYSCIKGRGTHDGINRLCGHIRKESQNYQEQCWVLKIDVCGYFMHIDRMKLLDIALTSLRRMSCHRVSCNSLCENSNGCRVYSMKWSDMLDFDFVEYLTRTIVLYNPVDNCQRIGRIDEWARLPHSKSLFFSKDNCGLPIGNLTSQLFSNVYMNVFDQFMKREMHCKHYGRYVDDAYIVSCDRQWLLSLIPCIRDFLDSRLELQLQEGKTCVCNVRLGVPFLGAYIKPHRNYVLNSSLKRMMTHLDAFNRRLITDSDVSAEKCRNTINSYLGVLSHYASFNHRKLIVRKTSFLYAPWGYFNRQICKLILNGEMGTVLISLL